MALSADVNPGKLDKTTKQVAELIEESTPSRTSSVKADLLYLQSFLEKSARRYITALKLKSRNAIIQSHYKCLKVMVGGVVFSGPSAAGMLLQSPQGWAFGVS